MPGAAKRSAFTSWFVFHNSLRDLLIIPIVQMSIFYRRCASQGIRARFGPRAWRYSGAGAGGGVGVCKGQFQDGRDPWDSIFKRRGSCRNVAGGCGKEVSALPGI